nr:molybdopterin-guanine dinucleotide biosynthesis protein MobB [Chromatiaceae bacterium]
MDPNPLASPIPVIGFVAPSGTGKTTLLQKLVPALRRRGRRIGYL